MKNMSNRAIFAKATRTLESAGFERTSSQFAARRGNSGLVFAKNINGKKEEVVLTFKLAKTIVENV